MPYTDLWRCKRCQALPEIQHVSGKHFVIECRTCRSERTTVEADSIDEVVREWNRLNDPTRKSLVGVVQGWMAKLTGR